MGPRYYIRNRLGWFLQPEKSVSRVTPACPTQLVIRAWDTDCVPSSVSFSSRLAADRFLRREFSHYMRAEYGVRIWEQPARAYVPEPLVQLCS